MRRRESERAADQDGDVLSPEPNRWRRLLKFHAALEIATDGKQKAIRCQRCGHLFCDAADNYKRYALHRVTPLSEIMPPLPSGDPYIGEYHFYFCPGCATQLQVDMFSPTLGGDPILWDTRIDAGRLELKAGKTSAAGARR